MKTNIFHITEIISVITGKMVATSHMDGICRLLEFMCGEPIYTHQIPRAIRECSPYLVEQFPVLATETADGVTEELLEEWAASMEENYGKVMPVRPLLRSAHHSIDAISELQRLKITALQ